mmetsp:Transcript_136612/g.436501  ORF Transcript_136612/g.436501 Transcript_136612/m.436501 type:complete len:234 (+) Transcript_136612:157-858(+)
MRFQTKVACLLQHRHVSRGQWKSLRNVAVRREVGPHATGRPQARRTLVDAAPDGLRRRSLRAGGPRPSEARRLHGLCALERVDEIQQQVLREERADHAGGHGHAHQPKQRLQVARAQRRRRGRRPAARQLREGPLEAHGLLHARWLAERRGRPDVGTACGLPGAVPQPRALQLRGPETAEPNSEVRLELSAALLSTLLVELAIAFVAPIAHLATSTWPVLSMPARTLLCRVRL